MLAQSPVFHGLPEPVLAGVEREFVARGYRAGETLYGEGAPAQALFVLATGRVKLSRSAPSAVVVDVVTPGGVFGALPALGQQRHDVTANAMVVSCALAVGPAAFDRIVAAHPGVAIAALRVLGAQLESTRTALARLALDSAEARLAAVLLHLADRFGHTRPDMLLLQLPLTRADLAGMAATTPETVSRALSRWKAAGWVATGRRWVGVVDLAPLRRLVGD